METFVATPSSHCRFLGTRFTQQSSQGLQRPGTHLPFGARIVAGRPVDGAKSKAQPGESARLSARLVLSKDGWIVVEKEQGTANGSAFPLGATQPSNELQESLQSVVRSLDELSNSLQRVSSTLNETLLQHDTALQMQSLKGQYQPQTNSNGRSKEFEHHGDTPQLSSDDYISAEKSSAAISEVAFKLQQAFVQARVDFLGKPFQVALEDFVDCTMQAHAMGVDLVTLQLQLLLAERACYGQELANDVQAKVTMEGHIRAMWVRLVYITLNHVADVRAAKKAGQTAAEFQIDPAEDLDGQGQFVKGIIDLHLGQGLTLDRLRLQQAYAEKTDSPAVEALQQSHYLILMTLAKALGEY